MAQALDTDTPAEQARDHMLRLLIAEQNDAFRRVLGFAALWRGLHLKGRTLVTPGFRALPEGTQAALMEGLSPSPTGPRTTTLGRIIPLAASRRMAWRSSGRSTFTTPPITSALKPRPTPSRRAVF